MIFKKYILFLLVLTGTSQISAQMQDSKSILITNYTFTPDKNTVGQISLHLKDSEIINIVIKGTDASLFSIDKNFFLLAKSNDQKKFYHIQLNVSTADNKEYTQDFTIVKDEFLTNKVIAHRGAWKNFNTSENSFAALKNAIKLGCQGSEFDVHFSADTIAFVNHDPSINGKVIELNQAQNLKQILLNNGEALPMLEDYLKSGLNQNKTKLILEIKPSKLGKERVNLIAKTILNIVKENKAQAWVEYISFDYEICKALLINDPYVKVVYLNGDKTPQELYDAKFYGLDYHYSIYKKNPTWIKEALGLGLTVNAWTVNDQETMQWLLNEDVNFITTNEPEMLLKMVK